MSKLIREATLVTEFNDLDKRIASVERTLFGEWIPFPYNTANFTNVVGGDQTVQYRVRAGDVQLRGVCSNQPATTVVLTSTVIGTLPISARPLHLLEFPVYVYDSNGILGTVAQLQIDVTGDLVIWRDLTGRVQTGTYPYYVTLNGCVSFSTA